MLKSRLCGTSCNVIQKLCIASPAVLKYAFHSYQRRCQRAKGSQRHAAKEPTIPRGNEAQKPYPTSREKIEESGNVKACREAARIRSFRESASEPKSHKGTQRRSQRSQDATKLRNHTPAAQRKLEKVEMSKYHRLLFDASSKVRV